MNKIELQEIKDIIKSGGELYYVGISTNNPKIVTKMNDKSCWVKGLDAEYPIKMVIDYYTKRSDFKETLDDAIQKNLEDKVERAKRMYKSYKQYEKNYLELKNLYPELFI